MKLCGVAIKGNKIQDIKSKRHEMKRKTMYMKMI